MPRILQYLSDLHLERRIKIPSIPQIADYLLLAGDIGYPQSEIYHEFLYSCSRKYSLILLVNGNHEWDKGNPTSYQNNWASNVHLLENKTFFIDELDVFVMGCTLWTPSTRQKENSTSIQFLETELEKHSKRQVICLTHHLPSYQLIVPKYQHLHQKHSRFANHLDFLLYSSFAPRFWICGHSHCFLSKKLGHTQCLINTTLEQSTKIRL